MKRLAAYIKNLFTPPKKQPPAMTKKEFLLSVLESMGRRPQIDEDGDVFFAYQLKNFWCIVGNEEDRHITLLLPQFLEVDEGEEALSMAICNRMTRQLRFGKVYVEHTLKHISAACNFYYSDEESLRENIEHSLNILRDIRTAYLATKRELAS